MLTLSNVEVLYANIIMVLRGVSLEVPDGGMVALLGANGAGKTTTLKAISGLLATEEGKVTAGTISFDGHYIENGNPEETSRLGIIQILEGRRPFEHLTVEQNLRVGAYIATSADIKKNLDMVYELFPKLKSLKNQVSGYLSGGEQQMLVIGRALMAHPRLILLDEPSLGLAPLLVQEIYRTIKRLNEEEKKAILLVEQNAKIALDTVVYGYVMENGRIVLDGPADKLKSNQDVQEFYLGLTEQGQKKSYREVRHYKRRKRWL